MKLAWPIALTTVVAALCCSVPGRAGGPGAVLIWPVDPVISAEERATALWLENPGDAPITLQVRVYGWAQQDGKNVYAAQNEVLGTPPILSIEPGQRQLVRLTRLGPPPALAEKPYRIVVDQIPTPSENRSEGAAVTFRMRYSLPLFSYAKADQSAAKTGKDRGKTPAPPPLLAWRAGTDAQGRFLEIRNRGAGHARLTEVAFAAAKGAKAGTSKVSEGLLGYVLPGATMRWPLPAQTDTGGDLVARMNGNPGARIERLQE